VGLIRANANFNVQLSDFEGPLDLLLHLIRESKLDIKTVPLATVTGQYMELLSGLERLDLDLASEFVEVGATLVDIKTRQILPRPKSESEEEDPEVLEARLRAQLEEYQLLKEASEKLKAQENVNRFFRNPEPIKEVIKYRLDNLCMDSLVEAFSRVLHKIERNAAPIVERQVRMDRFTVAEKIRDIKTRLVSGGSMMFSQLFASDFTRGEVINTFLAVLELLKDGQINASQDEKFGDILINKTDKAEVGDGSASIDYEIIEGIED